MKEYQRFCLSVLITTGCLSLGITAFNALVDPYGILNSPNLPISDEKVLKGKGHTRLFKAINVKQIEPVTIFLGTSRTERGLDPKHPVFADNQPAYNLALPGANQYEVMRYFEHAIANQPKLEQVVIGIDFFMFNQFNANKPDFSEQRLEKTNITLTDLFNTTFSIDALRSSFLTVASNVGNFGSESYRQDGAWISPADQNSEKTLKSMLAADLRETYDDYQLSPAALDHFRSIVETCRQRNIDVKVFISPSHATQWEAVRAAGLWSTFEQWKREIVKITPVWDFSGYNSITAEAIDKEMENYLDSSHYTPETGNLVLNRLFEYDSAAVPADFGIWITPQNVENHIKQVRTDRQRWASQNPEAVKLVQDIERRVARSNVE
ncbi:MAG: hypothetical protein HC827_03480 [Cyanobacteria bacterium RM1_2_2]|nr:hypothetical protein [Cyanobacteria bacterium RM1_2_2]